MSRSDTGVTPLTSMMFEMGQSETFGLTPVMPAEFAPLAVTDEDAEDAKPPAAKEDLDDKKADASLIVLEEDDEEDAADIIGDGVKKDEET